MHTQLFEDMQHEYNRHLRARRVKRLLALAFAGASIFVTAGSVAAVITEVANPLFSAIVAVMLIGGFWGSRYLLTHH